MALIPVVPVIRISVNCPRVLHFFPLISTFFRRTNANQIIRIKICTAIVACQFLNCLFFHFLHRFLPIYSSFQFVHFNFALNICVVYPPANSDTFLCFCPNQKKLPRHHQTDRGMKQAKLMLAMINQMATCSLFSHK